MATISSSPIPSHAGPTATEDSGEDPVTSAFEARLTEYSSDFLRKLNGMYTPPLVPEIEVELNARDISVGVGVSIERGNITLRLPLLFLVRAEDLDPSTPIGAYLKRSYKFFTYAERYEFEFFKKLCKNPALLEKAKSFFLSHEAAHIYYGDIYKRPADDEESQLDEIRADLFGAENSGDADGAIYFFNIRDDFFFMAAGSHPHHLLRSQYLTRLKTQSLAGKAIAGPSPARPGAPTPEASSLPSLTPSTSAPRPATPPSHSLAPARGRVRDRAPSSSSQGPLLSPITSSSSPRPATPPSHSLAPVKGRPRHRAPLASSSGPVILPPLGSLSSY